MLTRKQHEKQIFFIIDKLLLIIKSNLQLFEVAAVHTYRAASWHWGAAALAYRAASWPCCTHRVASWPWGAAVLTYGTASWPWCTHRAASWPWGAAVLTYRAASWPCCTRRAASWPWGAAVLTVLWLSSEVLLYLPCCDLALRCCCTHRAVT